MEDTGKLLCDLLYKIHDSPPTAIFVSRKTFEDYYNWLVPAQRFVGMEMARLGFNNLLFCGIPVIVKSLESPELYFGKPEDIPKEE